jgi:hypothetical protein
MENGIGPRSLRSFGLTVGGVFALLGVWPALAHGLPMRVWALAAGGLLLAPALTAPAMLSGPYKVWMAAGRVLGRINTGILLSVFFYVVLTPVGTIARLAGKDPMRRRFDPAASSYRQQRLPRPASHMRRQF